MCPHFAKALINAAYSEEGSLDDVMYVFKPEIKFFRQVGFSFVSVIADLMKAKRKIVETSDALLLRKYEPNRCLEQCGVMKDISLEGRCHCGREHLAIVRLTHRPSHCAS